ncbi:SIS domain-containing protein [Novosphingobium piscinae]|uniref:KpsF/GutQ family sugar-phosphate isomerase n=1 Tax=Novosphingobium piscinae TaxID=1507448 RepID=A0A7X1FXW7_9SPHN|nr:KpsF/GutQ family sugar-phosphate isomerase [Novosphingobium piscinae]MBC2669051.1 KpsF/GutQ family sugar-phosphate isomerase [Novosphingobium piscinae]
MTADKASPVETVSQTVVRGAEVIRLEAEALVALADSLDESFEAACQLICGAKGRVVISGMGKSGQIGRKFAATLAATGTPATYVHPAEAAHGDLGMLVPGDVAIVISNSGNTSELRAILGYSRKLGIPVIGIASNSSSFLLEQADVRLCLPSVREACPANIAPTTSTTMQLAFCDAIAMAVMDLRGFTRDGMKALHPGGSIGLRLAEVREIMHPRERLPLVGRTAPMSDVLTTMTSMGFGIAGVVDDAGLLVGVITDGDLRRHFHQLGDAVAGEVMTTNPKTLDAQDVAEDALHFFNEMKITCAFVLDRQNSGDQPAPVGVVHLHDFLRLGLA